MTATFWSPEPVVSFGHLSVYKLSLVAVLTRTWRYGWRIRKVLASELKFSSRKKNVLCKVSWEVPKLLTLLLLQIDKTRFTIFHTALCLPPPPPPLPKKNCITIVFDFFWDDCNTEAKMETMVMQNSER